ncbi:MAG: DUF1778 domain-containing protein [Acidobacteriota bacterium]
MATKSLQLQIRVTPQQKAALKRLAAGAGQEVSSYVLSRCLPQARLRFEELLESLAQEADRRFALAELNDLLTGPAGVELLEGVEHAGIRHLPALVQNYVAAMVEEVARRHGVAPPAWVADVQPLETPHFAVPFAGLRLHLLRAAPVSFKRRNIFVDSSLGARV